MFILLYLRKMVKRNRARRRIADVRDRTATISKRLADFADALEREARR